MCFDCYCIPMTATMPTYVFKEIEFKRDDVESWVRNIENVFNIKPGKLSAKIKGGRPPLDVSTIRRALVYHIYKSGYISVRDLGGIFNVDHSAISIMRQDAGDMISINDEKFVTYLNKVDELPVLGFINGKKNVA